MAKFQKGHPGGPGRPKGGKIEWCREFAEGEGKEKLLSWARSKNAKASMAALTLIFGYGFGKPTENHEVDLQPEFFERLEESVRRGKTIPKS